MQKHNLMFSYICLPTVLQFYKTETQYSSSSKASYKADL